MNVNHEQIEHAYTEPRRIVDGLPETTESKRARFHIDEAEKYTHEAAERARVIDREAPPAMQTRGPAVPGWPWRQKTDDGAVSVDFGRVARACIKPEYLARTRAGGGPVWTWTDGTAP